MALTTDDYMELAKQAAHSETDDVVTQLEDFSVKLEYLEFSLRLASKSAWEVADGRGTKEDLNSIWGLLETLTTSVHTYGKELDEIIKTLYGEEKESPLHNPVQD